MRTEPQPGPSAPRSTARASAPNANHHGAPCLELADWGAAQKTQTSLHAALPTPTCPCTARLPSHAACFLVSERTRLVTGSGPQHVHASS